MPQELPPLPFTENSLEPYLSAATVRSHYAGHHAGHVAAINSLIVGTEMEFRTLEDLLQLASGRLLAHASEAWSHAFYWGCLTPGGQGEPRGPMAAVIDQKFGSYERCRCQFNDTALSHFGVGWIWLVKDTNGELEVRSGSAGSTPFREALTPILACDLWEHAYYLDYHDARDRYLDAFWHLVSWDFVAQQYQKDPRQAVSRGV